MFLPCRIYEGVAIVLSQDVRSRRSPLMADGIMDDARSLHIRREVQSSAPPYRTLGKIQLAFRDSISLPDADAAPPYLH